MRTALACVAVVAAISACTGSDGDDAGAASATGSSDARVTTTVDDDPFDPASPTTAGDMRPVPTVPPSTIDGRTGGADGVVEVAPTLRPGPTTTGPAVAPGATAAPPSTDLVGDPQPSPDTTAAPPPSTVAPPPPACERLDAVGVPVEIERSASSIDSTVEIADGSGCRYEAGGTVVEVWFVPLAEVRDDWFERTGVEPVAEAGGDAVGLDGFRGVDGSTGAGYTVAVAGGADGAIVAVSGSATPRPVAGFVAALAAQAG